MKKTVTSKLSSILLFVAIISMVGVSSCSEDDPAPVPVDFTDLNASIAEAENLIATTTEGLAEGQYPTGSQADLQDAIDLAKPVVTNTATTQAIADNANTAMQAAIVVYEGSVIVPIDAANLVGHWQFNEGTGTTVADFSGNGFDGTFKTGHADMGGAGLGGGTPTWGEDRYGNAGGALVVDKGAFVEVPYNASLNPSEITVSLWVKAVALPGGRFLGLHSWNGYKFEIPDHGKPFFTAATSDGIWDNDAGTPVVAGEWYHLAVTYGGGNMTFFIDGTEIVAIPRESDMVTVTGHNLAIGCDSNKYADTDANYDVDKIIPIGWAGFFNGSLDELRIYKTALSASQIMSIYTLEKP